MATKDIIEIKRPEIVDVNLRIAGDTPLIMHRCTMSLNGTTPKQRKSTGNSRHGTSSTA